MYLNSDFTKNAINLFGCDEGKKESQLKAEVLTNELTKAGTFTLKVNRLYNTYGEDYKSMCDIPGFLWYFRLVDEGIMPILDKRFPTLEDIYKLMEDEGYTESDINRFKNIPNSTVEYIKKNMETVVKEGTASYDVDSYNWCAWMGDRTKPAPIEAVTFWKDYTETNTWKLTHDFSEELGDIYEDKTQEEIKEIVSTLAKNFFGDVLESTRAIPIDFDEKGGQKFTKTFADGTDEDTYKITDYYGNDHMLDGKEKAIEKATELVNEKIKLQFGMRIERKITEPDGYFAWRQENREDYL